MVEEIFNSLMQRIAKEELADSVSPSQQQLDTLIDCYQRGQYDHAEELALSIIQNFPRHQFSWKVLGALYGRKGRKTEELNANQKAVALAPNDAEAHNNLGITFQEMGILEKSEASLRHSLALKFDSAEAHYNLGVTLKARNNLEEAETSYRQAIKLKPNFAKAYNNLGNTLKELGKLEEAKNSYRRAHALKPDLADALWNLSGLSNTIEGAGHWIDKCLETDPTHVQAKLTKAALRYYRGDKTHFDSLMKTEFKQHPYMRSFSWAFSLPNLPNLYFSRWSFFDAILERSILSRPFYEFGVSRGYSFRYFMKSFNRGFGFDTFTGLPEDWDVGSRVEKVGRYSADGKVPDIDGGEFIVGKFENTLPNFFSEPRALASIINFDADLYSSTICALNYSKEVIDQNTILIFDQFIINENWEQDQFRALNEFCSTNLCTYEVIAISFFSKQVAVKLISI